MVAVLPLLSLWSSSFAHADAAVERRLYPDRVDASSFLWNDWNRFQENYHPLYAVDDDPVTAWVEGAEGGGVGEWVRFDTTDLAGTTAVRLRVRNGYQKSAALFKANARAREVTVRLLPGGAEVTATLADKDGWQELRVDQAAGAFTGVELRVGSVYPGSKYEDLCISDVEVYATSTVRDNPVAEAAKLGRVKSWKAERVAAALVFKAGAADHMPLAPSYNLAAVAPSRDYEDASGTFGSMALMLERLRSLAPSGLFADATREVNLAMSGVREEFGAWKPARITPMDSRPIPRIDGVGPASLWSCFDGASVWGDLESGQAHGQAELPAAGSLGYLRADTLGVFEATDAVSLADAMTAAAPGCNKDAASGEPAAVYAWTKMGPAMADRPARVEAMLTVACGRIEVREGSDRVSVAQLLVYDAAGRLTVLAGPQFATQFAWRGEGATSVLTAGRRVGMYGPDVLIREGRAVAGR